MTVCDINKSMLGVGEARAHKLGRSISMVFMIIFFNVGKSAGVYFL